MGDGRFNFIAVAGKYCVGMDHGRMNANGQFVGFDQPEDPNNRQMLKICDNPGGQLCTNNGYQGTMFCVTCTKCPASGKQTR